MDASQKRQFELLKKEGWNKDLASTILSYRADYLPETIVVAEFMMGMYQDQEKMSQLNSQIFSLPPGESQKYKLDLLEKRGWNKDFASTVLNCRADYLPETVVLAEFIMSAYQDQETISNETRFDLLEKGGWSKDLASMILRNRVSYTPGTIKDAEFMMNMYQEMSPLSVSDLPTTSVEYEGQCPDCLNTPGKYQGLSVMEVCQTCSGKAVVTVPFSSRG